MRQRSSSSGIRLGLLAAALAGAVVFAANGGTGPSKPRRTPTAAPAAKPTAPIAMNSCSTCLERGVLLDPSRLANGTEPDVRLAYEAARKYPDTLDRIHCFCECKESLSERHKTLLTCFTSAHAAGCGICQREAIMAAKLKDQGYPDEQVEMTVESVSKTDGHPPTFGRGM
jgi:Protein of unknown function with PCYCGC motif